jgi:uncharacterized protein (TIGR02246 family)
MKGTISMLVFFLVAFISCNQKTVDKKAEGEKIMQLSKEWSSAAATGDAEKTLSYWADDAVLIAPHEPLLNGKEQIRQMVNQSFNAPGFKISWQPQSVQVSDNGDMAYLIEDAQVTYTDSTGKSVTQQNKAVSIWRKQSDGSWKNIVDISTPK